MTLAIALQASDGLVLAADRQLTVGDSKIGHGKLEAQRRSEDERAGVCVVSGAGSPDTYLFACIRKLKAEFFRNPTLLGDELRDCLSKELAKFFRSHVIPFAPYPPDERPSVSMLVGYQRQNETGIMRSDGTVFAEARPYGAVGSGFPSAYASLDRIYRHPPVDIWQTVLLSAYVMRAVAAAHIYVSDADICVLTRHRIHPLRPNDPKRLNGLMEAYSRSIEASTFRATMGVEHEAEIDLAGMHADFMAALGEMSHDCGIEGVRKYPKSSK